MFRAIIDNVITQSKTALIMAFPPKGFSPPLVNFTWIKVNLNLVVEIEASKKHYENIFDINCLYGMFDDH